MSEFEATPSEKGHGDNTIALFLGLYLLVLAFFILLVTISSIEKVKSNAVMDSLTSTFKTLIPPSTQLTAFQSKEGDVIAGQQFQEEVTGIFATTLQVAKVEIVQPGRLMRVKMAADAMFHENKAAIREAHRDLIDRLVAALSGRPPGQRFDMEFLIGAPDGMDRPFTTGNTLPMQRAGAFAAVMESRGAPPDSMSVGFLPGVSDEILINFYVRDEDETKLRFDASTQIRGADGARR
jgi:hypothetical protein